MTSIPSRPFWRRPDFYVLPILIAYLIAGPLLATDYGETTDEVMRINYAQASLQAYHTGITTGLLDEKGPFFGILSLMAGKILRRVFTSWVFIDTWHFMTFVSFLIGVFFFYRLCLRLVRPGPALAATLVFSTQPLIWGHAFINPKDMPFMAFFIAAVCLGLEMVDRIFPREPALVPSLTWREVRSGRHSTTTTTDPVSGGRRPFLARASAWLNDLRGWAAASWDQLRTEWKAAPARLRWYLIGNGLLLAALVGDYWAINPFRRTIKMPLLHNPMVYFWLTLILGVALVITFWILARKVFPAALKQVSVYLPHGRLLLAGCFLGFASDIRTLGPAVGLLVGAYLLFKGGRKALPALLEYVGIGAIVTYVFWPNLWIAPLTNYWSSLSQAADFPWLDTVLFGGTIYKYNALPFSFIPVIFTLQFTEGALALMLGGLVLAGIYFFLKPGLRLDLLLLGAWLVAPVAAAILLHSTVYDNARQFLFVLPPLFILAALALQFLWDRLRYRWIFAGIALVLAAQGLYWNVRLHPYEYIYYNSLVGGVRGAFRNFELDYWAASYKADFEYLNQTAPQHAKIYVYGPDLLASTYIRPDLVIIGDDPDKFKVDYAVILNKRNLDVSLYENSPVIFKVERENSILSVIKKIGPGDHLYSNKSLSPWPELAFHP